MINLWLRSTERRIHSGKMFRARNILRCSESVRSGNGMQKAFV